MVARGPAHEPVRPSWKCESDGEDWPCRTRRQGMMLVSGSTSRAIVMSAYFEQACADMPGARAGELHRRFFSWLRDDEPARNGSTWT